MGVSVRAVPSLPMNWSLGMSGRSTRERAMASAAFVAQRRAERREVVALLRRYGVSLTPEAPLAIALARNPAAWREFQPRFEREAARGELAHALKRIAVIAGASIGCAATLWLLVSIARALG
jgi:aryl-alcohol dehydrogenase-like predicted oxidoreductase